VSTASNKALIRQWLAEVERRDFDAAFARLAPQFIAHLAGSAASLDRAAFRAYTEMFHAAFTNERITIEEQVAEDDIVATRITYTAMHSGELSGLSPTGKPVRVMGAYIDRIVGDQIVERTVILDQTTLIAQLGVIPAPGQGGS
jgi:predicted ester cyclase